MLGLIFDSHAHYDDAAFDPDREQVLAGLEAAGVGTVVNCGADLETSQKSAALAQKFPFFYASAGIHPENAAQFSAQALDGIRSLCKQPKCVAVGEIGLDYYWEGFDREEQKAAFSAQLALAKELGLPAIVHSRDATEDSLALTESCGATCVFHCFSGSAEVAKILVERGFYLGFGGALTFKNARRAVEAAAFTPLERILLETDCPYMAPEPHRGQRNTSALLPAVAERLAQIKGISPEEVVKTTAENAKRFFNL